MNAKAIHQRRGLTVHDLHEVLTFQTHATICIGFKLGLVVEFSLGTGSVG